MVLTALSLALAIAQSVPHIPDPRTPMPRPWVQPGYLQIVWIQSPNWGSRPEASVVDTIVVHATVIPTLEKTTEAFLRESSQVSAHFTIDKDGSIVQHVDTFARAWHAGVSRDETGRENLNHYSIGIELVNLNDGKDPFPEPQLMALCGIIAQMKRRFPIKRIVSHEFIAQPQGRKSDPRNFSWTRLEYLKIPIYRGLNEK